MSPYLADDALARMLALALQTVPDADLSRRSCRMTHYGMFAPGVSAADAERLDHKAYLYELRRREAFAPATPAIEPMRAAS